MLIKPMEPILSNKIRDNKDWIHQIKWDGIRGITYIQNNSLKIFTKRGIERTPFYPELSELVNLLNCNQAILDGEIVVFDKYKRPSFSDVLVRERVRKEQNLNHYIYKYPITYIVFDILSYNGKDLREIPFKNRKEILNSKFIKSSNITVTDDFSDGEALFELMKEKNYEGIVSKNINSNYIEGKKHDKWFKIKISKKMLCVIGGISIKNNFPSSLMLGIYKNSNLIYIGNASSGLTAKELQLLKNNTAHLAINKSPFSNINKTDANTIWLNPKLTCWVNFIEWTNKNSLRHPKILGFSNTNPLEVNGKEFTYARNYRN